jgi:hypothetical protein
VDSPSADDPASQGSAPDPDTIVAELRSDNPDLVAHALEVLDTAWQTGQHSPVPLPSAESLTAFGDDLAEDVVDRFNRVVQNYVPFTPSPEPFERHTTSVDAVLRYGPGQPVFDVAMFIRVDDNAELAVQEVMRYIPNHPAETETELMVVEELLGYLLDARSTHDATVRGLTSWAFRGDYPDVVDSVLAQLDDSERARVLAARDDEPV